MNDDLEQNIIVPNTDGKLRVERYKNTKWRARASIGDSKYKYKTMDTKDRNEAVKKALRWYFEIEAKVKAGLPVFEVKFNDVVEQWATKFEADVKLGKESDNMFTVYKSAANAHLLPFFKEIDISKINEAKIEEWFDWELAKEKKLSKKSLSTYGYALKLILEFANTKGYIKSVPEIDVPDFIEEANSRSAFSIEEWKTLSDYIPAWVSSSPNDKQKHMRITIQHIVHFMYNTGFRPHDLGHLTWGDLTFFEAQGKTRCSFLCKGKTTGLGRVKEHTVIGEPEILSWVNSWKKYVGEYTNTDKIFPDRLLGMELSKCFSFLTKAVGLDKDSRGNNRPLYSLRHTYATMMLNKGVSAYIVAENLGTNIANIQKTYAHLSVLDRVSKLEGEKKPLLPFSGELKLLANDDKAEKLTLPKIKK